MFLEFMVCRFGKLNIGPMKNCFLILLVSLTNATFSQKDYALNLILEKVATIQEKEQFDLNYWKIRKYEKYKADLSNPQTKWDNEQDSLDAIIKIEELKSDLAYYINSKLILDFLYQVESDNYEENQLKRKSRIILQTYTKLKAMSALLTVLQGQSFPNAVHKQFIQKKLIHAISIQMQTVASNTLPLYNYPTTEKVKFKGLQIESSNDLLAPFQKNNDMDYTGSLKVGIITDMLKLDLFKPTQSYQLITYGGEVYTPYFKDANIFVANDTFNPFDRPHGSFQYIGLENHGIAEDFKGRWLTNVRVGIIGGRFGYNFQYYLHKDLSISPAPVGWDAQIGFPGRIALQGNFKYERLLCGDQCTAQSDEKFRIVPSISGEIAVGHFMSYAEFGLNFSRHNFAEKNQVGVISKSFQTKRTQFIKKIQWYADYNLFFRGVLHNSMLEGYGVFRSSEINNIGFAEKSKYILESERIRRLVIFSNLKFGIQLSRFNLFYELSIKSPEYKSEGLIKTYNKGKEVLIDPNFRWHHYASVGLAITL